MRNSRGFTLIEIIVAVALVAILSAAVAPSVLNNISSGRIARAQSDVQAIASAVIRFKSETGYFPNRVLPGSADDTLVFNFLASDTLDVNFALQGTGALWPTTIATGGGDASMESMIRHLLLGKNETESDSYPRVSASANPDDLTQIGFRGPVLSASPLDPWRHAYIVNVGALDSTRAQPVWVVSAGPNGILETEVDAKGLNAAQSLGGDDIGFRVK